ncbi:MAG: hypothetical protein U1F57_01400 [bacterium]
MSKKFIFYGIFLSMSLFYMNTRGYLLTSFFKGMSFGSGSRYGFGHK